MGGGWHVIQTRQSKAKCLHKHIRQIIKNNRRSFNEETCKVEIAKKRGLSMSPLVDTFCEKGEKSRYFESGCTYFIF